MYVVFLPLSAYSRILVTHVLLSADILNGTLTYPLHCPPNNGKHSAVSACHPLYLLSKPLMFSDLVPATLSVEVNVLSNSAA